MLDAVLVVAEHVLRGEDLVAPVGEPARRVLEPVDVVAAGPAIEVAHVRAQAGLVRHRDLLRARVRGDLAVVGGDVGAVAGAVEQVAVGLAVRPDARADRRALREHPHRVAGRRDRVDDDVALDRPEVLLLDVVGQPAFPRDREAGRDLHGGRPALEVGHRVAAGEYAARRDQRDVELLGLQPPRDLVDDRAQVVLAPVVEPEPEVPAGQRSLDDHVVGQPVQLRVLAQEELQRAQRRDDDAELRVAEAPVVGDLRERAQVQAGGERDAVDARVERGGQAHAQRLARRVHRELLHAVHEDHAVAALGLHRSADVHVGRLGQPPEVELHRRLVAARRVVLVELRLLLDEVRAEAAVGDRRHHRVGDVADAAQPRDLEREPGGRDVDAHAAAHDRYQLALAEAQAKIVDAPHVPPGFPRTARGLGPRGTRHYAQFARVSAAGRPRGRATREPPGRHGRARIGRSRAASGQPRLRRSRPTADSISMSAVSASAQVSSVGIDGSVRASSRSSVSTKLPLLARPGPLTGKLGSARTSRRNPVMPRSDVVATNATSSDRGLPPLASTEPSGCTVSV